MAATLDTPGEAPVQEDEYTRMWRENNATWDGAAPGSKLTTLIEAGDGIRRYALAAGQMSYAQLMRSRVALARGLELAGIQLLLEAPRAGENPCVVEVTIIEGPVAKTPQLYTGPLVGDGEIGCLGEHIDGQGELSVRIRSTAGMEPLALIGATGTGTSNAGHMVVTGAMATGEYHFCFVSPQANGFGPLAKRARIAIVGPDAKRAPELIWAIMEARGNHTRENEIESLCPSTKHPGWVVYHEDVHEVLRDSKAGAEWCQIAMCVRQLGIWPVVVNRGMQAYLWGDDQTQRALTRQGLAFYDPSFSEIRIPGMHYRPCDLPVDEHERPVPGFAVPFGTGRSGVPVQLRWLPGDSDDVPEALAANGVLRTSEALDRFFKTPEIDEVDLAAIRRILGDPNEDGCWVVGPEGIGTHEFPKLTG